MKITEELLKSKGFKFHDDNCVYVFIQSNPELYHIALYPDGYNEDKNEIVNWYLVIRTKRNVIQLRDVVDTQTIQDALKLLKINTKIF